MGLQQFLLVADRLATDEEIGAIFDRCADLGVGCRVRDRQTDVCVDRDAPGLLDAALAAIRDLDEIGLCPTGIREEELVSLEDVAARLGRSAEAVRLWAAGRVGPGAFPAATRVLGGVALYSWREVRAWLRQRMRLDLPDPAPVMTAVDLALRLRALAPQVGRMAAIRALIPS
jgi:hypothetical protein